MGIPSRLMFHVKQHSAGTVGLLNRRIGAEVGSAFVRAEVLDGRGSHADERPHRSPIILLEHYRPGRTRGFGEAIGHQGLLPFPFRG
jgi:hypothetical protein